MKEVIIKRMELCMSVSILGIIPIYEYNHCCRLGTRQCLWTWTTSRTGCLIVIQTVQCLFSNTKAKSCMNRLFVTSFWRMHFLRLSLERMLFCRLVPTKELQCVYWFSNLTRSVHVGNGASGNSALGV